MPLWGTLFQISTGEKLEWPEHLAVIHHFANAYLLDGLELLQQSFWWADRFGLITVQFVDVNGVLTFSGQIAWEEIKLISWVVAGFKIGNWSFCDRRLRFGQIERYLA